MTAGAPNHVEIEQFRLYPIHLKAKVTVTGLDLGLARLYLPPDAPVLLDRGRASSVLDVTFDARDEVRADLSGEVEDLVLVKPGEREPVTRIPKLTAQLTDFTFRNDQARVGRLELQGSASVRDPRARQGARFQVSAIRASVSDVTWPIVEREKQGRLPLTALWDRPGAASPSPPASGASEATTKPPRIEIGEIAVRNGVLSWRDETVEPRATLDVSQVDATITGAGWPLRPLGVRLAVRPPGGGRLDVAGRVGIDPLSADLRLHARDAELAHYQAYVPARAQFSGRADLDLAVVVPGMSEPQATVRGDAVLSRVDVRDGQRTVIRIDRAAAAGLDVDWPRTIKVREIALRQPWVLLERDAAGALPLRPLLIPETATAGTVRAVQASTVSENGRGSAPLVVRVRHLSVDNGGARVVDGGLNPPFAVDIGGVEFRVDGLSTAPGARPARIDLKGRVGDGLVDLAGTIGPVAGPLRLDLQGDLREFAVPRTNPYLLNVFAWEARNGRLSTGLQCRIDGDKLPAKADVLVSRLQLAKAGGRDEAQARIGLPLGMLVSLMKDRHGDIRLALPIAGRVTDPRVDFKQLLWSTVRNATLKVITAPVSWIGRVRFDADSRIERIEVDPIQFEPGTATPTAEGRQQLTRLVAFLDQTPEARLMATPVVSSRDVAAMKQPAVDAAIDRVARDARLAPDAAAARVFQERFPQRPLPATPDAIRAALLEGEMSSDAVSSLAAKRMESVRATLKKASIVGSRLTEAKQVESAEDGRPQVKLDFAEPESRRRE